MKRFRPILWFSLCLLVFLAAVFLWQRSLEQRIAESSDRVQRVEVAAVPAPVAPVAKSTQGSSSIVSFYGSIPGVKVNPKVVHAHATESNPHRLSNTGKKFSELMRRDRAILLRNAFIDTDAPVRGMPIPDGLKAGKNAGAYLVQARGGITPRFLQMLRESGATFAPGAYIPHNTYVVRAEPAAAQRIQSSSLVHRVLPYEPYYKLDTKLLGYAVNRELPPFGGRMRVTLFPGERDKALEILAGTGTEILSEEDTPFGPSLIVLPEIAIWTDLAMMPEVQGVERHTDKVLMNDLTRTILHVSTNSIALGNHLNLTGTNVLVAVNDQNGVDAGHPNLTTNRVSVGPLTGTNDTAGHFTFVAGIIAASGVGGPTVTTMGGVQSIPGSTNTANFRGMAPEASIFGLNINGGFSESDFSEIPARTNLFIFGRTNTLLINNSWGFDAVRTYDANAAIHDARVRDAIPAHPGMQQTLPVFAAGNSGFGSDSGSGGLSDRIPTPSTLKNGITVGATETLRDITNEFTLTTISVTNTCITNMSAIYLGRTDSSNQVASFSSRGNVDPGDEGLAGRFKPDLVAPGSFQVSTRSRDWDSATAYTAGNVDFIYVTYSNVTIAPLQVQSFVNLVPINATNFLINPANQIPASFNLNVYTNTAPDPSLDPTMLAGSDLTQFELTPAGVGLWYIDIENTNAGIEITFDMAMVLTVTNCAQDFNRALSNLNERVSAHNPVPASPYRYGPSGTSFSAPAVTGMLALMQEFFEGTNVLTDPNLRRTNSAAMMKALIINSARSVSQLYDYNMESSLNYQGWGMPSLVRAIPPIMATETDPNRWPIQMYDQTGSNSLPSDFAHEYDLVVAAEVTNAPLRISLVWTDPPGNPASSIKLVNDLDLVLSNVLTGDIYRGNSFNGSGDFSEVVGATNQFLDPTTGMPIPGAIATNDVINNVENIYLNASLDTTFKIYVIGNRVNVAAVSDHTNDITQDYALVVSSANGEFAGGLTMSAAPNVLTNYLGDTPAAAHRFSGIGVMDTNGVATADHRAGANSALIGETNTVAVNGMTSYGTTNQWVFFAVTNNVPASENATNGLFATFRPLNLSEPRNDDADVDLYVSTDSGLTNLDEAALTASIKSLSRGGTEVVEVNDSAEGDIFYIGVKSEDQMGAEFSFFARFFQPPPGGGDPDEPILLEGFAVPIPDGTPQQPAGNRVFFFNPNMRDVRRVTVTNLSITHQLMGDLVAELFIDNGPIDEIPRATVLNHRGNDARNGITYIFDDSEEGNVMYPSANPTLLPPYYDLSGPATRSDGPRTLDSFVGQEGFGLWQFVVSDNQLFHTGTVDAVSLWVEPVVEDDPFDDGINGMPRRVTVCTSNSWVDAVNVPAGAVSFSINVAIDPATLGPLNLYVRRDEVPTSITFDHFAVIQPPGGTFTITVSDTPALNPGRYFIRLEHTGSAAPMCIDFTVDYDGVIDFGAVPKLTQFNSTQVTILDDARTNSLVAQIPVTVNNRQVVAVRAGFRIAHERASDLAIRVISPTGTDVLLAENRGRFFTNGFGVGEADGEFVYATFNEDLNLAKTPIKLVTNESFLTFVQPKPLATNFLADTGWDLTGADTTGNADEAVFIVPLGNQPVGTIDVDFEFRTQPDRITVYERSGGVLTQIGDTGFRTSLAYPLGANFALIDPTDVDLAAETMIASGNPFIVGDELFLINSPFPAIGSLAYGTDLPMPLMTDTLYTVLTYNNVTGEFQLDDGGGNPIDLMSQGVNSTYVWGRRQSTPPLRRRRTETYAYNSSDAELVIIVNEGSGTTGTVWDYVFTLNPDPGVQPNADQIGTGITSIDGRVFAVGSTSARAENGIVAQFATPLREDATPFYSLNWPDLRGGTRFNDVAATSVGVFAVGRSYTATQDPQIGVANKEAKGVVARFPFDDPSINATEAQGADFHQQIPDFQEGLFWPHANGAGSNFANEEEAFGVASATESGVEYVYITGVAAENSNNPGRMFLSKMNTAGIFQFHTNDLFNMTADAFSAGYDVTERNGVVYVAGANADGGTINPYVMALDSSLVPQWTYTFNALGQFNGITVLNDAVYAVGMVNGIGGPNANALVVKLDLTGAVVWTRTYGAAGLEEEFNGVLPFGNRIYVVGSAANNTGSASFTGVTADGMAGVDASSVTVAVSHETSPRSGILFTHTDVAAGAANDGINIELIADATILADVATAADVAGVIEVRFGNGVTSPQTIVDAVNAVSGTINFTAAMPNFSQVDVPIRVVPSDIDRDGVMYEILEDGSLQNIPSAPYNGVTVYTGLDAAGDDVSFNAITTDGFEVYITGLVEPSASAVGEDLLLMRYQVKEDMLPEESLDAFIGESATGNWRLEIWDGRTGGTNGMPELLSWQLQLDLTVPDGTAFPLTHMNPIVSQVETTDVRYFIVHVPFTASEARIDLRSSTGGPIDLWFGQNSLPIPSILFGQLLTPDDVGAAIQPYTLLSSGSAGGLPDLVPGQRFFLAVVNDNTTETHDFEINVTFNSTATTFAARSGGPVASSLPAASSATDLFQFNVFPGEPRVHFDVKDLTGDIVLRLRNGTVPDAANFDFEKTLTGVSYDRTTIETSVELPVMVGTWYASIQNVGAGAAAYDIEIIGENAVPVVSPIADFSLNEGGSLSFTAAATDPNTPLIYTLTAGPFGVAIDTQSGLFTWMPGEADGPGTHPVTIKVTDSGIPPLSATETFNIVVKELNSAPVLPGFGSPLVDEGVLLTLVGTANDGDIPANSLSYELTQSPAGAAISSNLGVITWTPGESDGGQPHTFTVTVTDNGVPAMSATATFDVAVAEVNSPPALTLVEDETLLELTTLRITNSASDVDVPLNQLVYSFETLPPAGMTLDADTGIIDWTPSEAQGPGIYAIGVVVTDNGFPNKNAIQRFSVTVLEHNLPPVISPIGNQVVAEGQTLTIFSSATDPDLPVQSLLYQIVGAPTGMIINPNSGEINWTPTEAQGPAVYSVEVIVNDGGNPAFEDSTAFDIQVDEVNAAPTVAFLPDIAVDEGAVINFTATASDSDVPVNNINFALGAGSPAGASIDSLTGEFNWTVTEAQGPGVYTIYVLAGDDGEPPLLGGASFTVSVAEINSAPILGALPVQAITEGGSLSVTIPVSDPDLPSNRLIFSLEPGAPSGVALNPLTGALSWASGEVDGPLNVQIPIRVTDDGNPIFSDTGVINITVVDANSPPVLMPIGGKSIPEGSNLAFTVSANDEDLPADMLIFSLVEAPAGVAIDPISGVFSWTPSETQGTAVHRVTVKVTDNGSPAMSFSQTFTISVGDVNQPPAFDPISDKTVAEGESLIVTLSASDSDLPADSLLYSIESPSPSNVTLNPVNGQLIWTPTEDQGPGIHVVTVGVRDNGTPSLSDMLSFNVTVEEVNAAPVLDPIGDVAVNEGSPLRISPNAEDADLPGNLLTYSLDPGAPAGMTIEPVTGVIDWAPGEADGPDDYTITIRVTDDGAGTLDDSETITVTVREVNTPPSLAALADVSVNEQQNVAFAASASDVDLPANGLTFTLAGTVPTGASIHPQTGDFTWTPSEEQGPGVHTFDIVVSDNGAPGESDLETISITVNEINVAPTIPTIGDRSISEGEAYSLVVEAVDADRPANELTFTLEAGAVGMAIHPATGEITWSPGELNGGTSVPVTVRVTDNGAGLLSRTESFTIQVIDNNSAPDLAAIENQSVNEGSALNLTLSATDSDDPVDQLTYTLEPGAPAGMMIDAGSGAISWTPSEEQGPATHTVTVRVTDDGTGLLSDTETFSVTVGEVNTAPEIAVIGDRTINELTTLSLSAVATDADLPANQLTYSLDAGAPAGMSINASSGAISWTPAEAQGPDVFQVTARATDNGEGGLSAATLFSVTVDEVNSAPMLASIANRVVAEGTQLTVNASTSDADSPANQFAYSLAGSVPMGASIHPQSGVFTWTPGESQGGSDYVITVVVTDDANDPLEDLEIFVVTVNDANSAPIMAVIPDLSIDEGALLTVAASATDNDEPADRITYSLEAGAPAGMTLDVDSGVISWTPTEAQGPGNYPVTVRATDDGEGALSGATTFTVAVAEANIAPTLAAIGARSIPEATVISFAASATDGDEPANGLTFSLDAGAPAGASINPQTGLFAWTPAEADGPGIHNITVRVTDDGDGNLSDSETISVTVSEVNTAPTLSVIAGFSSDELTGISFVAAASDVDLPANGLTYSLGAGAPAGLAIDPGNGRITWTPTEAQGPGTHQVTVIITDDGDGALSDSATFSIQVNEVNLPPTLEAIADRTVNEGSLATFTAAALDPDEPANNLTYALQAGAPAGALIDPVSGVFSWTPTEAQGPGVFPITVRVTDNGAPALSATQVFSVQVDEVNHAPTLATISNQTISECETLSLTLFGFDEDQPTQTLTFSLGAGAPEGASIDAATGRFTFETPGGVVSHEISVIVTDDGAPSMSATLTFTVTVNELLQSILTLANGTALEGTASSCNSFKRFYRFTIPSGTSRALFELYDLSADADLLLRKVDLPSAADNDAISSTADSGSERIVIPLGGDGSDISGVWYLAVQNQTAGKADFKIRATVPVAVDGGSMLISGEPIEVGTAPIVSATENPTINFAGVQGEKYVIEVSDDLISWTVLTEITISDSTASVVDPTPYIQQTKRFYRIRQVPQ
jgi:subtilisin-like proprotein convertase family protein